MSETEIIPIDSQTRLGVHSAETKEALEARRQSVVRCVQALNGDGNLRDFKQAVREMFTNFGLPPAQDPKSDTWNTTRWEHAYAAARNTTRTSQLVDIEVRSTGKAYGNIYAYLHTPSTSLGQEITVVVPGACSIPMAVPADNPDYPEPDFYRVFETDIGVDLKTTRGQDRKLFYVTASGDYRRVDSL